MTKDQYFELCETMGSEPIDSEIPVELEDFPDLIVQCFLIYRVLPDIWDTMGGNYLGKDYNIVFDLLNLYSFDQAEQLLALDFLQQMDTCRGKVISEKIKARMDKKP